MRQHRHHHHHHHHHHPAGSYSYDHAVAAGLVHPSTSPTFHLPAVLVEGTAVMVVVIVALAVLKGIGRALSSGGYSGGSGGGGWTYTPPPPVFSPTPARPAYQPPQFMSGEWTFSGKDEWWTPNL